MGLSKISLIFFCDGPIQNAQYKRRKLNFGNSHNWLIVWHIYTTIYWIAQVIPIHCCLEFFNLPLNRMTLTFVVFKFPISIKNQFDNHSNSRTNYQTKQELVLVYDRGFQFFFWGGGGKPSSWSSGNFIGYFMKIVNFFYLKKKTEFVVLWFQNNWNWWFSYFETTGTNDYLI